MHSRTVEKRKCTRFMDILSSKCPAQAMASTPIRPKIEIAGSVIVTLNEPHVVKLDGNEGLISICSTA